MAKIAEHRILSYYICEKKNICFKLSVSTYYAHNYKEKGKIQFNILFTELSVTFFYSVLSYLGLCSVIFYISIDVIFTSYFTLKIIH